MTDTIPTTPPPRDGLNPELRSRTNLSRDTETPTPPPVESASVQHEEGRGWPMVWLVVTVVCVVIALYLIF